MKIVTGQISHEATIVPSVAIRQGYSPYADAETGTWWQYDPAQKTFVDTGLRYEGEPGRPGEPGEPGAPGEPGRPGEPGAPYDDTQLREDVKKIVVTLESDVGEYTEIILQKTASEYKDIPEMTDLETKVGYAEIVGNTLAMYSDDTKTQLIKSLTIPSAGTVAKNAGEITIPFDLIPDTYINIGSQAGQEVPYAGWKSTSYIDVRDTDKIICHATFSSNYCAGYDASKVFKSTFSVRVGTNEIDVSNYDYIRISATNNDMSTLVVYGANLYALMDKVMYKQASKTWKGITFNFYKIGRLVYLNASGQTTEQLDIDASYTEHIAYPAGFEALAFSVNYLILGGDTYGQLNTYTDGFGLGFTKKISDGTAKILLKGTPIYASRSYIAAT